MPLVNTYYQTEAHRELFLNMLNDLKSYAADQLSCKDIVLSSDEISIRILRSESPGMIGKLELEIFAYAFPERVSKQDEICLSIMDFIQNREPELNDTKVWLVLSELGHSWK